MFEVFEEKENFLILFEPVLSALPFLALRPLLSSEFVGRWFDADDLGAWVYEDMVV